MATIFDHKVGHDIFDTALVSTHLGIVVMVNVEMIQRMNSM